MAQATYDTYGSVELRFPYHPALIAALKAEISRYGRRYDPDRRTWIDAPSSAALAVRLLRRHFPGTAISDDDGFDVESEPIRPTDQHYAVLHLLPGAPLELVQTAYRTLAKQHHPDRGGSHEAMRRLNEALKQIEVAS